VLFGLIKNMQYTNKPLFANAILFILLVPKIQAQVWQPDPGNGFYKNPIVWADYLDPHAIRVGQDFYMTASSFNCVPALPILHSNDLVN